MDENGLRATTATAPISADAGTSLPGEGYFTLSGDINSDLVQRVFAAAADMTAAGLDTAHLLLQSHGGYISDGICLYNFLRNLPLRIVTYNAGAVASIAVIVFLAGRQRHASATARFMVHKSHASPPGGSRPQALQIIAEGLEADDRRTESILRQFVNLSQTQWDVHAHSDLHLNALAAQQSGLIDSIADFCPPPGTRLLNI